MEECIDFQSGLSSQGSNRLNEVSSFGTHFLARFVEERRFLNNAQSIVECVPENDQGFKMLLIVQFFLPKRKFLFK
jgi:hypothetical protein